MTLLANLLSADLAKTCSAYRSVRSLHDLRQLRQLAEHLDEIRDHAHTLPEIATQSESLAARDFVLHKLEHVRNTQQCLCALYLVDDLFSPAEEARQGHIRILDTVQTGEIVEHYECQCTRCGARYQVEENEYYRTWWAWRVSPNKQSARAPLSYAATAPAHLPY